MTTSNDPDEIRADIERTRAALSDDVDELAETVKPQNVARRQVDKVKEAASNVKERVMGSNDDDYSDSAVGTVADKASYVKEAATDKAYAAKDAVADKAYVAKDAVSEKASEAGEAVRRAPATLKRKARGNPLAAGVITVSECWSPRLFLPPRRSGRPCPSCRRIWSRSRRRLRR
jgi:hypothetical protein